MREEGRADGMRPAITQSNVSGKSKIENSFCIRLSCSRRVSKIDRASQQKTSQAIAGNRKALSEEGEGLPSHTFLILLCTPSTTETSEIAAKLPATFDFYV